MALPSGISAVTMTGTLVDDQGTPLSGVAILTPSVDQVVIPSGNAIIQLVVHRILLDEDGSFSIAMIPTSDPDVLPGGVFWTLTHFSPGETSVNALAFVVPTNATTADISNYVINSAVGASTPQYLIGYRGASAYEVAVQNGYTGTVTQWLASLAAGGTGGGGVGSTVTASQISDSTAIGRNLLTATSTDVARNLLGAGTSSVAQSGLEGIMVHNGTTSGGTRPSGYARVRWVGGTTRPTNMVVGDIWEHSAT